MGLGTPGAGSAEGGSDTVTLEPQDTAGGHGPSERPASQAEAWYAVWTRSRHEQVVRSQLANKGVETFLPTITRWSRWKDRKKKIDWPLFPGYCFARFDPRSRLPILKCTGVVSIISFNGDLAAIPDIEIESVRRLVESNLQYDPCPLIREGMMVEVVHGPLKGVVGRLVRKGAHARLVLSVDLIGKAVSAEVDAADVRPF
jgi:transcription antitermination factor NusG